MKRWPVVVLVSLALVLLLSPAIIGRLAERRVDDSLSRIERENEDIRAIQSERFKRGWFTSEGQYRIELNDGLLASLINESTSPGGSRSAAVVLETRIDHGLVPFGSMDRDEGSLQPGIASSVTTVRLESADGRSTRLPGVIHSFLGLTGNLSANYRMEPGSSSDGQRRSEWSGADLTLNLSADRSRVELTGSVLPLRAESNGVVTRIDTVDVDLDQDLSRFPLGIGTLALSVDSLGVESAGSADSSFAALSLRSDFGLDDERISGEAAFGLSDLSLATAGSADIKADMAVSGIDAEGLAAILATFGVTNSGPLDLRPVDATFATLADRGGRLDIRTLEVTLPEGRWESSLTLDWAATDNDAGYFSLPGFLLRLEADADVTVDRALFERIAAEIPEARVLLENGMLQSNGGKLSMTARFAKGRMTVNGEPFTIPLDVF